MTTETNFTQTPFQALVSGSFAGAMTPMTYQGLYNIKVSKQNTGKLPWDGKFMDHFVENFKKLNIGLSVNMAVQGSLFGIQSGVNKAIVKQLGGDSPTEKEKALSSIFTGIITSPIENASEAVMIKKKIMTEEAEKKGHAKPTYRQVFWAMRPKSYVVGLPGMVFKTTGFTSAYIGLAPYWAKKINDKINNAFVSDLIGGASAGALGCFATQGFDTISTMPKVGKKIEWSPRALWKGGAIRAGYGALAVAAFTSINEMIKKIQK